MDFEIVHLEQKTTQWLDWRREGIGASDSLAVMGVSPWMSRKKLVEIKAGLRAESPANKNMRRGATMEEPARESYMEATGNSIHPDCIQSSDITWLRASLDGLNVNSRLVVEIKCPGPKDHKTALGGEVPSKYIPQLQHILAVTGYPMIEYWSYFAKRGKRLEVPRDEGYIEELLIAEEKLWHEVLQLRT